MYIYKISNNINGKFYIGKAINAEKRFKRHKYLAKKGVKRHFYNAIRKYGENNFTLSIIEECDNEIINDREKYWIERLNATNPLIGYNNASGGEGGNTWQYNTHKEDTKKKLSQKLKGHAVNYDAIKKQAEKRKGTHIPEKQKQKISATLKEKYKKGEININIPPFYDRTGSTQTKETRKKMSNFSKGKTYEERYGKEIGESLREKRKKHWEKEKNPNYKNINTNQIIQLIKQGYKNKEICKILDISNTTIWEKLKKENLTANQIRREKENE